MLYNELCIENSARNKMLANNYICIQDTNILTPHMRTVRSPEVLSCSKAESKGPNAIHNLLPYPNYKNKFLD